MGRLISPSKPPAQQVMYVPAATTPAATPAVSETASENPVPTDTEVATEKAENILRRNRSRLGTVLTSFRGVLDQNALAVPRKSLLGE